MSTQFINRLKAVMAEHKITQTELAKRTGIRQSSISDWLNNRYEPKQDKVYILANALNVSPAWLLGYDDSNIPPVQSIPEKKDGYYTDPEVAEYAEELRANPKYRLLFDASKDLSKEDIDFVVDMIERLKAREGKE